MTWLSHRIEDIAHAWSVVWEKRGTPLRKTPRLKGVPAAEVDDPPPIESNRGRGRDGTYSAYQAALPGSIKSARRYIPRSGGILGWFQNAGVLNVEKPNNYQLSSALDESDVRTSLAEHARD